MLYPGRGTNYAFYDSSKASNLLDKASQELDATKRAGYYRDVQIQVAEDLPYIPLFYQELSWGAVKGFGGLYVNPCGPHNFSFCYVKQ